MRKKTRLQSTSVSLLLVAQGCRFGYEIPHVDVEGQSSGSASLDQTGSIESSSGDDQLSNPSIDEESSSAENGSGDTEPGGTGSGGAGSGGTGSGAGSNGPFNLAFVSSTNVYGDLGSLAAYDQICNDLAVAASLSGADGSNFVAYMSDDTTDARDRVAGFRGWTRVDGTPFADEISAAKMEIFNSIGMNENGSLVNGSGFHTGSTTTGTRDRAFTCSNWTDRTSSSSGAWGATDGGPSGFSRADSLACHGRWLLLCMMLEHSNELAPTPSAGKLIYATQSTFTPGGGNPDTVCEFEKPAGTGPVKALLTTTTSPAGDLLSPTQMYVRPDGIEVGLGSEIVADNMRSGIWQPAAGGYPTSTLDVWTGSPSQRLDQVGDVNGTCDNWTNSGLIGGHVGNPEMLRETFRQHTANCGSAYGLYCVEQ